ncbi:MAG: YidC/Oxa1 family membrane protein insertase [Candidatus Limnocylindrales bacterium]|jgi:YidC/Oxa1 family membrane protein insertase
MRPDSHWPIARRRWIALALLVALVALAVVACGTAGTSSSSGPSAGAVASAIGSAGAGGSPAVSPSPTPEPLPLAAAQPTDPFGLLSWAFTPIFQALFILLAEFYALTGNVLVAIVILTLIIRLVTVRLSARTIVSQQRMQRLQPELKALQKELQHRYKGDRMAVTQAQQEFYKERGVSPTAGCLPSILQMGMLIPMYSVIRIGLTNFDPSAMLTVFGVKVVPLTCPNPAHFVNGVLDKSLPCINTVIAGIDMGKEQVLFSIPLGFFSLGVSVLAFVAAGVQVVQSRMMMPPAAENDPSASTARSMMIFMPLISILYGGILPAGLFIYWIVTSLFSTVQQFLIIGWGSMFPILGWNPGFARNYTPRFPVTMPEPANAGKSLAATRYKPEERWASAASTVRPNTHRRAGRRGRRR